VAHWIGLVNGFSNPVSKINKVERYITNGSVKGKIYPWSYIYDQRGKGVKDDGDGSTMLDPLLRQDRLRTTDLHNGTVAVVIQGQAVC
jgi:hypothetical protein